MVERLQDNNKKNNNNKDNNIEIMYNVLHQTGFFWKNCVTHNIYLKQFLW